MRNPLLGTVLKVRSGQSDWNALCRRQSWGCMDVCIRQVSNNRSQGQWVHVGDYKTYRCAVWLTVNARGGRRQDEGSRAWYSGEEVVQQQRSC